MLYSTVQINKVYILHEWVCLETGTDVLCDTEKATTAGCVLWLCPFHGHMCNAWVDAYPLEVSCS